MIQIKTELSGRPRWVCRFISNYGNILRRNLTRTITTTTTTRTTTTTTRTTTTTQQQQQQQQQQHNNKHNNNNNNNNNKLVFDKNEVLIKILDEKIYKIAENDLGNKLKEKVNQQQFCNYKNNK
ncbi:hypothetical protein M0813_15337 [Anaeramoeba flamelloides]|uniref:Uncharacterized protein n=1 Tax=Anaeramoeba flamelloides TaxID=1746091 RepID=A0ABQ8Z2X2_9EUKA|nr:hypothetical protein M0813_15337 [Anaeramoeba flamelloides]